MVPSGKAIGVAQAGLILWLFLGGAMLVITSRFNEVFYCCLFLAFILGLLAGYTAGLIVSRWSNSIDERTRR